MHTHAQTHTAIIPLLTVSVAVPEDDRVGVDDGVEVPLLVSVDVIVPVEVRDLDCVALGVLEGVMGAVAVTDPDAVLVLVGAAVPDGVGVGVPVGGVTVHATLYAPFAPL